ncbi:DHS-like NAD/FAD-binding domain-containing protein [Dendryphion nanum]|uniref:DHS-like NAD/FAD-binding domain-containing protein n=1 Tax=Dendryphion nanum TaxID=256645 RepID=A0A9P9D176_9PLEO|nr:DHS-like NAD/FAD-binding domain-containing protein [Dendryphion nanum]
MAPSGFSGPVMVQEAVSVPVPVIDLASSQSTAAAPVYNAPASQTTKAASATAAPSAPTNDDDDASSDDEWESTSLIDEILENPAAFSYPSNSDGKVDRFTVEEARRLKERLHEVGASQFVLETVTNSKYSARMLLSVFVPVVPAALMDANVPDESLYPLLGRAINKELNNRQRLPQYKTIDDAAKLLRDSKNIIVITGAGISTSLGIPDFRSKNTGFYSKLRELGFSDPEEVFDIDNFDEDATTFYTLAGDILPDLDKWTPTHEFIRLLQDKDKLLTNYTQNIDNVEANAGIRKEKLIQCHGSWATATCRKCDYSVPGEEIFDDIRVHRPVKCIKCVTTIAQQRAGMKRKRSSNGMTLNKKRRKSDEDSDSDGAYTIESPGIMKPDITFFGEPLPQDFFDRLRENDKDKVDLAIVIGTSMQVAPVSEIPNFLPANVPQIYISRDPIHHINFDINLLGDSDTVVAELARRAGWDLQHKMLPKEQKVEVVTVDEYERRHTVKVQASEPKAEAAA